MLSVLKELSGQVKTQDQVNQAEDLNKLQILTLNFFTKGVVSRKNLSTIALIFIQLVKETAAKPI